MQQPTGACIVGIAASAKGAAIGESVGTVGYRPVQKWEKQLSKVHKKYVMGQEKW